MMGFSTLSPIFFAMIAAGLALFPSMLFPSLPSRTSLFLPFPFLLLLPKGEEEETKCGTRDRLRRRRRGMRGRQEPSQKKPK